MTFQFEGNETVSSDRLNVRVFITLSFVTVIETFAAVPGTRYSCCEDKFTSISLLATTDIEENGSKTELNKMKAKNRLDFLRMASPQHSRHSSPL